MCFSRYYVIKRETLNGNKLLLIWYNLKVDVS